jgi:hypothetical protein
MPLGDRLAREEMRGLGPTPSLSIVVDTALSAAIRSPTFPFLSLQPQRPKWREPPRF